VESNFDFMTVSDHFYFEYMMDFIVMNCNWN